jgi:uncharacterized membrane protein YbhN (UPF0104 family)
MPELTLLPVALIPLALVELTKAVRWRVLFGPLAPAYDRFLQALIASQAANALAPFRFGDVLGVGVLVARGGSIAAAAVSWTGAKALDAVGLAIIACLVVGLPALGAMAWSLAGGTLAAAAGLIVAAHGSRIRSWADEHAATRWLPLGELADLVASLRSRRIAAVVAVSSSVVWVAGLAANSIVLVAVGAPVTLDLAARVLVAGYLVNLLPAPPARLGVFEVGVAAALLSADVPLGMAIAAAGALHACQLINLGLLMGGTVARRRWLLLA